MTLCLFLSLLPRSFIALCCGEEFRGISIFVIPYRNLFCQKIPAHQPIYKFHLRIQLYSLQWWEAQFGDNKLVAYEYKSHFLQLSHSLNWSFSFLYCKALNSYFFAVRLYGYPVFNAPERLHASINFNPCTHARFIIRLISFCTEVLKYILKPKG